MPVPVLDPADLVAFVRRDWGALDAADRATRARPPPEEKFRLVNALYAAAKATNPGWPTNADREADLRHHLRLRAIWDRADRVGR